MPFYWHIPIYKIFPYSKLLKQGLANSEVDLFIVPINLYDLTKEAFFSDLLENEDVFLTGISVLDVSSKEIADVSGLWEECFTNDLVSVCGCVEGTVLCSSRVFEISKGS